MPGKAKKSGKKGTAKKGTAKHVPKRKSGKKGSAPTRYRGPDTHGSSEGEP